jgi:hypothetical protein
MNLEETTEPKNGKRPPRPLERRVRQWNQSGFAVVSFLFVADGCMPLVQSFHTAEWEAESEMNRLAKILPLHLLENMTVKPATLTFDA